MARPVKTVEPASEPLTSADVKLWLRWAIDPDDTSQDTVLTNLIKQAREEVERRTDRQLITATWQLALDCFPDYSGEIQLYPNPVIAVSSIAYADTDGATQTLSASDYQVDVKSQPARITPAYGETWPSTRTNGLNAVTVTYTAGYGTSASSVPENLRHAMRLLVAAAFENREAGELKMASVSDLLILESWGNY